MDTFQDKVIIVTGASEGIGRALCLALAPQKPKLVLAARNQDRLEELKQEVESRGAKAMVVPTDMVEETACKHLIDKTISAYDRIDVLVNNAGRIVKAMKGRDRLAILSARGKLGRWVKLIAPGLIDKVALKAIREAK